MWNERWSVQRTATWQTVRLEIGVHRVTKGEAGDG